MITKNSISAILGIYFLCASSCFRIEAVELSNSEIINMIDNIIEDEFLTKGKVSGLGLSIVKDGKVFYSTGYGHQDVENNISATSSSLFFPGSIGKSITSTIVVKTLSEKFPELGEAALDKPISELIPSYNLTLSDRYRSRHVSFRDLLAHRVGETPANGPLLFGTVNSTDEIVFRLRYAEEISPFRTGFVYNNLHYALTSDILAEIAEKPFLQLVEEFFQQVGMNDTTYIKDSDDHYSMVNRSVGYYWKDEKLNRFNSETFKNYIPVLAAGGYISSADDMAKYALLHLNNGKAGGVQVVPEAAIKWMYKNSNVRIPLTWKQTEGEKVYNDYGYGLGLFLGSYDGWHVLQHGGLLPPFLSRLTFFPELKVGIFTSAGSTGDILTYNARHDKLHITIIDILRGIIPLNKTMAIGLLRNDDIPGIENLPRADLNLNETTPLTKRQSVNAESLYGHYGNGLQGELDILRDYEGRKEPYLRFGKWGTGFLRETEPNMFAIEWDTDLTHNYYVSGRYNFTDTMVYDGIDSIELKLYGKAITVVLTKNQYLKDLPVIPWMQDGCRDAELSN